MRFSELASVDRNYFESLGESYSRCFPESKLSPSESAKFLMKKYGNDISTPKNLRYSTLIQNDSIVVAGYGVIPNSYRLGATFKKVGLVCDVFTHPDYRRMGLFKRVSRVAIERETEQGTDFLIGFPIREEVMPGHLSVGWQHVFDMNIWWALPRVNYQKILVQPVNYSQLAFLYDSKKFKIEMSDKFFEHRSSYSTNTYFSITNKDNKNFAIFTRGKIRGISFLCILYLQSDSPESTKTLIEMLRRYSFRLRTFGIIGCWNDSYASELHLPKSILRRSKKHQKVILKGLSSVSRQYNEKDFQLSWIDSDTL